MPRPWRMGAKFKPTVKDQKNLQRFKNKQPLIPHKTKQQGLVSLTPKPSPASDGQTPAAPEPGK